MTSVGLFAAQHPSLHLGLSTSASGNQSVAASPGSASSRVSGAAKFGVFAAALAFTGSPYLDGYQQRESPQSTARWISFADAGITATSPLGPKLAALMSMSNGWDDGDGLAPRLPAITRARDLANALGPHYVTSVMLNPSLEGGVMFERQIGAAR